MALSDSSEKIIINYRTKLFQNQNSTAIVDIEVHTIIAKALPYDHNYVANWLAGPDFKI